MQTLDIALKDIRHQFSSLFGLMFMFAVPLLIVAMFTLAFGGTSADGPAEFSVPVTKTAVVNLDTGRTGVDLDPTDANPATSAGDLLVRLLASDEMQDLVTLTAFTSADAGRAAVDSRSAEVALIVPASFTTDVLDGSAGNPVEVYQDPTVTLGPSIVRAVVGQYLDYYASARIMQSTVAASLAESAVTVSPATMKRGTDAYVAETLASRSDSGSLQIKAPPAKQEKPRSTMATILSVSMAGMMVFYVFYTGATGAETILIEQEQGTLQRLFTTRATPGTVLKGKLLGVVTTTVLQMLVLILVSTLAFKIDWGRAGLVAIALGATALCAAAFGVMLVSFMKSTRQAGIVLGGIVTATGMMALMRLFTMNSPTAERLGSRIALFAPQGWSARAFTQAMDGSSLGEVMATAGILLVWAVVMFAVGRARMAHRFA
jgi:ABC-type transport system involved in multi-copper enzyme maturation permease subunit